MNKYSTPSEELRTTTPTTNAPAKQISAGKDSVVMGNVSGIVGDGSVVIGATDNRGNTILNMPMAIGRDAHAGPGSIAIGANAGAGSAQVNGREETKKTVN